MMTSETDQDGVKESLRRIMLRPPVLRANIRVLTDNSEVNMEELTAVTLESLDEAVLPKRTIYILIAMSHFLSKCVTKTTDTPVVTAFFVRDDGRFVAMAVPKDEEMKLWAIGEYWDLSEVN
jgi:hypothetical protein